MIKEHLFWNWFVANEERFRTPILQEPQAVQPLFSELIHELQRYCPGSPFSSVGCRASSGGSCS